MHSTMFPINDMDHLRKLRTEGDPRIKPYFMAGIQKVIAAGLVTEPGWYQLTVESNGRAHVFPEGKPELEKYA